MEWEGYVGGGTNWAGRTGKMRQKVSKGGVFEGQVC